eukprot:gnl/Trimastix_PCT/1642.p1 GENE.gnl/Trimastix_PCT/1642~~gnl/Trimastix_PCT/1642.p1  ORF type:complete len:412 (+),score=82.00 gnl/Trimastix_PCT/1642:60-1295(+)
MKNLLVIDTGAGQAHVNWYALFEGMTLRNGEEIKVEVAQYQDIAMTAYSDRSGVQCQLNKAKNPIPESPQTQHRTFRPDFLLVRTITRGLPKQDSRNLLYGFMFAGIPAVNSLESQYMCLERPIVYGQLLQSHRRLGDRFPLIGQTYYPDHTSMIISPPFPAVMKVAHVHAGYGKMRLENHKQFEDFRSVCAVTEHYTTGEEFIDWDFDVRVQKIGRHYRAYKRYSPNWKGNVGNATLIEETEMTPLFQLWIDECATYFGGMDILAIDAVHRASDDRYFILEVNDTAIGLTHDNQAEDSRHIVEVTLDRMNATFCPADTHEALSVPPVRNAPLPPSLSGETPAVYMAPGPASAIPSGRSSILEPLQTETHTHTGASEGESVRGEREKEGETPTAPAPVGVGVGYKMACCIS